MGLLLIAGLTILPRVKVSKKEKDDYQSQKEEGHFHRDRMMAVIILEREREREQDKVKLLTHDSKSTYNSNDCEKHDDSKCKEGNKGIGLDLGVAILIHLDQNYTSSDKHEGSIYKHKDNNM